MPLIADLETMMPHLRDTLAEGRRGDAAPAHYDGMERWRGWAPVTRAAVAGANRSRAEPVG
jgi:hypothetical protein